MYQRQWSTLVNTRHDYYKTYKTLDTRHNQNNKNTPTHIKCHMFCSKLLFLGFVRSNIYLSKVYYCPWMFMDVLTCQRSTLVPPPPSTCHSAPESSLLCELSSEKYHSLYVTAFRNLFSFINLQS